MKTDRLIVRVSADDKKQIQKATKKFHKETGAKENVSATIRHIVKQYNTEITKEP
jgi:hypothetical protein